MEAPSGTVTLLFSDVVGSTLLWERDPAAMGAALRIHDEIVRRAIETEGGYVFKTVGDEFCAAFSDAADAVRAAAAIQRVVGTQRWPSPIEIGVRIGVHAGFCEERDGDYFGPAVNRTARLASIAHAGQVVVSAAAAELVAHLDGHEVHLRDLGQHRLRDLGRPEHVYQADFDGVRTDFPALRSLDAEEHLNNLPTQLTSFVGRTEILARLVEAVGKDRLVTLTGSGGSGKTRLALQVAADLVGAWSDGVWFVDLSSVIDGSLVCPAVLSAMGIHEDSSRSPEDSLVETLASRSLLVVLDNCEHVIDVCASVADRLVHAAPGVNVLATSREPLGVAGERVVRVPSMGVPDEVEGDLDPAAAEASEAVRLFVERARDYQPEFRLDGANAARVVSLCRQLDGIPLALELAAARLRSMGVDEIEQRLDHRFRLLTGGSRSSLPRQRTLEATVNWSFELLGEDERTLLCRLAVFSGFDLAGAESVGSLDVPEWEVADLLRSLVDKSLVQTEVASRAFRYRLLDSIRHFSFDRLADRGSDEVRRTRRAHAEFFRSLSREGADVLRTPDAIDFLWRMESEHQNLQLAIHHFLAEPGHAGSAMEIIANLREGWNWFDHYRVWMDLCDEVLTHPETQADTPNRAEVLYLAGFLRAHAHPSTVDSYYDDALTLARRINDRSVICEVLAMKAFRTIYTREEAVGLTWATEALRVVSEVDDEHLRAFALDRFAAVQLNNPDVARAAMGEALAIGERLGNVLRQIITSANLGNLEAIAGDFPAARDHLARTLRLSERLPSGSAEVAARTTLALVLLQLDDVEGATEQTERLVPIARRAGVRVIAAVYTLLASGCVIARRGHLDGAARVLARSDELFDQLGYQAEEFERVARAAALDLARESLAPSDFASAYAQGRAMTTRDALDLARTLLRSPA